MSDKSDDPIFKSIIDDLGNDENYSCSESNSELNSESESESESDQKINKSVKNITANNKKKNGIEYIL